VRERRGVVFEVVRRFEGRRPQTGLPTGTAGKRNQRPYKAPSIEPQATPVALVGRGPNVCSVASWSSCRQGHLIRPRQARQAMYRSTNVFCRTSGTLWVVSSRAAASGWWGAWPFQNQVSGSACPECGRPSFSVPKSKPVALDWAWT
jgi:hypothetical protein